MNTKIFIDDEGTFEIQVPTTWKYSLKGAGVTEFREYEILKRDVFQISINKPNENIKKRFDSMESPEINGIKCLVLPEGGTEDFKVKYWMTFIDNKAIMFMLTHSINPDEDIEPKPLEEKLDEARQVMASFKLIKPEDSESKLNSYRFDMFLQGLAATSYMLNKAVENHAFIEATCLFASQIDGLLRIGIILQKQIVNNDRVIEKEWIYQGLSDGKKTEKNIYKKAKELGILDDTTFDKLYKLYDDRNRVIHRFIISEITLAEVENITHEYYQMREKITSIVHDIETKQIELGVGMTMEVSNETVEKNNINFVSPTDFIRGKIGKQDYFEEKD